MCYIYSALVSVQLSKQLQRMWEKSSLGETKASIQSGICKQTAVGRVEADERWVDSDELNMLSNSELESHFLLRQRWNHNFAYETLFLFLFGFVCFYFFFWVTTKGFLHAKLFTRSALRSAISIESTLSVSEYLGRVDGALTHTHMRVVPGIVQEVNKIKKQSKLLLDGLRFQLKFSNYIQSWIQFACLLSLSFLLCFYLSLEKSILQWMLCAASVKPKAKGQRRCVSTQDTHTDTRTMFVLGKVKKGKLWLVCCTNRQRQEGQRGREVRRKALSASHTAKD